MDAQTKQIYKQAIEELIPVMFYYSSQNSPYFPGEEQPAHARIVQPVCLGYRTNKRGEKIYYVRAFLLQKYSFSKNRAYPLGSTTKKYAPKVKQWRLYRIDRQSNLQLLPDYPQEYRAYVWNYPSYNENDSFFTRILYKVPQAGVSKITYKSMLQPYNIAPPDYSKYATEAPIYRESLRKIQLLRSLQERLQAQNIIDAIVLFNDPNLSFLGFYENKLLFLNSLLMTNLKESTLVTKLYRINKTLLQEVS